MDEDQKTLLVIGVLALAAVAFFGVFWPFLKTFGEPGVEPAIAFLGVLGTICSLCILWLAIKVPVTINVADEHSEVVEEKPTRFNVVERHGLEL